MLQELLGKTCNYINQIGNEMLMRFTDGTAYRFYHQQDCCESVGIEDIEGDLNDLLDSPLLQAEVVTNSEDTFGKDLDDSFTWTFYKFATIKGYVTVRWLGTSNGYYSESVTFEQI